MKIIIEVALAMVSGVIGGWLIYLITKRSDKFDEMASKNDVENSLKESKQYTDKAIVDHEKVHSEIRLQYSQIQNDLTLIKNHLLNN